MVVSLGPKICSNLTFSMYGLDAIPHQPSKALKKKSHWKQWMENPKTLKTFKSYLYHHIASHRTLQRIGDGRAAALENNNVQ